MTSATSSSALMSLLHADLVAATLLAPSATTLGGLPIDPALSRLIAYAELLDRWNARVRLVGPRDLTTLIREQLVDALGFVAPVQSLPDSAWYDVGAGGGLPGVVLALLFPERTFLLIEPIHKKTAFLKHVTVTLSLPNIHIHTGRVLPTGALDPRLDPILDAPPPTAALSRATLAPAAWFDLGRALLRDHGTILTATATADALPTPSNAHELARWTWTIPATQAPRHLVAHELTPSPRASL